MSAVRGCRWERGNVGSCYLLSSFQDAAAWVSRPSEEMHVGTLGSSGTWKEITADYYNGLRTQVHSKKDSTFATLQYYCRAAFMVCNHFAIFTRFTIRFVLTHRFIFWRKYCVWPRYLRVKRNWSRCYWLHERS